MQAVGAGGHVRRRWSRPHGLAVRRIAGASVVAVDVTEEKLQLAKDLGAEYTVNAANEDPVEVIQALGGADAAIALAAGPEAVRAGLPLLRRRGRLVPSGCPLRTRWPSPSSRPS